MKNFLKKSSFLGVLFFLTACATDTHHRLLISTADQKMIVYQDNKPIAIYPVSTSKFGIGDNFGSCATPLGHLYVCQKIGDKAPIGTVFKDRKPTGEILIPNAPGRDPIVTRLLWLKGKEPQNRNAFDRYIYIHGTPEERNLGKPASYGCIRMRSVDVVELYDLIGKGAQVEIVEKPLQSFN